jgi:hypothetical protein
LRSSRWQKRGLAAPESVIDALLFEAAIRSSSSKCRGPRA